MPTAIGLAIPWPQMGNSLQCCKKHSQLTVFLATSCNLKNTYHIAANSAGPLWRKELLFHRDVGAVS